MFDCFGLLFYACVSCVRKVLSFLFYNFFVYNFDKQLDQLLYKLCTRLFIMYIGVCLYVVNCKNVWFLVLSYNIFNLLCVYMLANVFLWSLIVVLFRYMGVFIMLRVILLFHSCNTFYIVHHIRKGCSLHEPCMACSYNFKICIVLGTSQLRNA